MLLLRWAICYAQGPVLTKWCYAMYGTGVGYDAMRCPVGGMRCPLLTCAALGYAVLVYAMVLCDVR
eukprot:3351364-Rhodomonas_salina.1